MAMRKYFCVFADDSPFRGYHLGYDEDEGFQIRMWEARLPMSADKMFGDLSTPSGIQVMFAHDAGRQSVGRVVSMRFEGKRLVGEIELSEEDVAAVIAGGCDALEAGINPGLSCGFVFLENPPTKMKQVDGSTEKPDKMTYGRLELREVSLTNIPRLKNAGIIRRLDSGDDQPKESEDGE